MIKRAGEDFRCNRLTKRRPPGFLLSPFGWAAERLALMIESDPSSAADLFRLSRKRMHLIALALARFDGQEPLRLGPTPLVQLLLRGSTKEILDASLGCDPPGLARALGRFPPRVMAAESYRSLIELLRRRNSAKLLHHAAAINDSTIKLLREIPEPLRPAVFAIHRSSGKMDGLADGLRLLARRGAASSFETLIAELASARQPGQLIAKIKAIVRCLCRKCYRPSRWDQLGGLIILRTYEGWPSPGGTVSNSMFGESTMENAPSIFGKMPIYGRCASPRGTVALGGFLTKQRDRPMQR
jgi:hypothetical protein